MHNLDLMEFRIEKKKNYWVGLCGLSVLITLNDYEHLPMAIYCIKTEMRQKDVVVLMFHLTNIETNT
jgi:hypothetical protein